MEIYETIYFLALMLYIIYFIIFYNEWHIWIYCIKASIWFSYSWVESKYESDLIKVFKWCYGLWCKGMWIERNVDFLRQQWNLLVKFYGIWDACNPEARVSSAIRYCVRLHLDLCCCTCLTCLIMNMFWSHGTFSEKLPVCSCDLCINHKNIMYDDTNMATPIAKY